MESWTLKEMNLFHLWGLLLAKNRIFAFSLAFVCLHSHSAVSDSLQPHGLYPTRLLCPWDSPGYWSGLPCPPPGNLPNSGLKPASLTSPALVGRFFITSTTWEAQYNHAFVPKYLIFK